MRRERNFLYNLHLAEGFAGDGKIVGQEDELELGEITIVYSV